MNQVTAPAHRRGGVGVARRGPWARVRPPLLISVLVGLRTAPRCAPRWWGFVVRSAERCGHVCGVRCALVGTNRSFQLYAVPAAESTARPVQNGQIRGFLEGYFPLKLTYSPSPDP